VTVAVDLGDREVVFREPPAGKPSAPSAALQAIVDDGAWPETELARSVHNGHSRSAPAGPRSWHSRTVAPATTSRCTGHGFWPLRLG
jgi:hypothetical protein